MPYTAALFRTKALCLFGFLFLLHFRPGVFQGNGAVEHQSSGLRIGIDGSCLANRRGFGRFARQTLAALAEAPDDHQYVVFVDRPSSPIVKVPERFERVVVAVDEVRQSRRGAYGTYIRLTVSTDKMERAVAGTVFSDGKPRIIQIKNIGL